MIKSPIKIYNDNEATVKWSQNLTNKRLRHIQMRENAVCENYQRKIIKVLHIGGKLNPSDMFTKEEKEAHHFLDTRNSIMISESDFDLLQQ